MLDCRIVMSFGRSARRYVYAEPPGSMEKKFPTRPVC